MLAAFSILYRTSHPHVLVTFAPKVTRESFLWTNEWSDPVLSGRFRENQTPLSFELDLELNLALFPKQATSYKTGIILQLRTSGAPAGFVISLFSFFHMIHRIFAALNDESVERNSVLLCQSAEMLEKFIWKPNCPRTIWSICSFINLEHHFSPLFW